MPAISSLLCTQTHTCRFKVHTHSWGGHQPSCFSQYMYLQRNRPSADWSEIKMKVPFRCNPTGFGLFDLFWQSDLPQCVCVRAPCVSFPRELSASWTSIDPPSLALLPLLVWHPPWQGEQTQHLDVHKLQRRNWNASNASRQEIDEGFCFFVFLLSEYAG